MATEQSTVTENETQLIAELLSGSITLPKTVQGDGRYLMTLLSKYLQQMAVQVDIANGFSAEEINPVDGSYPTPRNFYLSFDRTGGKLTWTHLADISELAYYETRTDTKVGEKAGLLDRTTDTFSTILPVSYVGTVYLYAVSQSGVASNPSTLTYSKPRPDAPTDISAVSSSEGTLVTFSDIPSDCIGANLYIGGAQYQSTTNLFLYVDSSEIDQIEVAFYDQFGEGERGILYLVLPDVTGFLVERNGSELDFYWDPVNVTGVSYVVKVGARPDWEAAMELFRTKTNDKNRYIYPQTGEYYLLVKATDEYGNYSRNATYQLMANELEINRNIILRFDQDAVGYSGTKINVYYDAGLGGITLERVAMTGEYIFKVELEQRYKARNWIDYSVLSLSGGYLIWDDCDFTWDECDNLSWAGVQGNIDGVNVSQQITYYKGMDSEALFEAELSENLLTRQDEREPDVAIHADDFRAGRWATGLFIDSLTELEYTLIDMTERFNMTFWAKTTEGWNDTMIVTLADPDEGIYLTLGYNSRLNKFYLRGSDGVEIWAKAPKSEDERDWFFFGIIQGETERALYILNYPEGLTAQERVAALPVGHFTKLYCYPKIIISQEGKT